DVLDCWFESGSMPFAQLHYPFERQDVFDRSHPADFISEGVDQTRGWFFSLLAESTLLFDRPAYRNCVVVGVVVDRRGKKMSKSRGNAMDPGEVFDEFGADAARWYFYSAGSLAGELQVSRESFASVVRLFMLTLWNVYSFFVTYAEIDGFDPAGAAPGERPVLDRWVLARLAETVDAVRAAMDRYDAPVAARTIELFVEDVSKWYVRRSRRRFWAKGDSGAEDKAAAYATLHTVLLTVAQLLAPMMPFLSERMYRNLCGFEGDQQPRNGTPDSVHLTDYPEVAASWRNSAVVQNMARLRRLVEDGLAARTAAGIKVRQPLAAAVVAGDPLPHDLEAIFLDEINVKRVSFAPQSGEHESVTLDTNISDELRVEGVARELTRKVNDLRKQGGFRVEERVVLRWEAAEGSDVRRAIADHGTTLAGETLSRSVEQGRGEAAAEWEGELGGTRVWLGVAR
ncbi:MAG: class I tRNA ligase family protein, partial [Candidatus Dormibacteraeota bacterium]|nr:class I tRNA ligase family protein [Candidatus Dormibacteraeota bacterium]